ncbi:hypothetical protein JCM17846_29010 [Iodidimonas nitroreducens]|uniref:Portal protein n=1 Tax=Iodidimonas nitroreducens TaxID=1236968 RepID=A0A5A7NDR3_9PROT|nr:phage portal protein [Iodidimonas nitroreducens]GAK34600.1 portal protein [alpha proteobacterium Q-1]GER05219.1 hypothetical protein JCM17846_29010 [Iodidimonas nitroreducens]
MNIIQRMFKPKTEELMQDPSWQALHALSPSGQGVNARMAENLSTVLACVSAVSTSLASLPAWVYRRTEGGRELDETHPLMRIVRRGANAHQTWPDFIEWLAASTMLRGNGLAEIVTDSAGRVMELRPIPWEWVSVQMLASGRLAYDVTEMHGLHGPAGRRRRLLQGEVLHIRDRSDDGIVGKSRLQRAAKVIAAGLSIQEFSHALLENGARPSGALQFPHVLTGEQHDRISRQIRESLTGSSNAAKFLVLEAGVAWNPMSISPEDAELLASRRFTGEELARIFGCPPPIIGDLTHGTFTNSETLIRFFAQTTLSGWLRKLEAEFVRSVFTEAQRETHELEIDMSGLLRGDPETRWKSHEIAVKNKILTPNEVREVEGWNPRDDGNQFVGGG